MKTLLRILVVLPAILFVVMGLRWITDPTGGLTNIRGNVFLALWDSFQANGISIPFPQREVRMLGEEPAPA